MQIAELTGDVEVIWGRELGFWEPGPFLVFIKSVFPSQKASWLAASGRIDALWHLSFSGTFSFYILYIKTHFK